VSGLPDCDAAEQFRELVRQVARLPADLHRVRSTGRECSMIAKSLAPRGFVLCVDAAHGRVFALDVADVVRSYGRAELMSAVAALLGWGNRRKSDSDSSGGGTAQPGIDRADHALQLREILATAGRENPGDPAFRRAGYLPVPSSIVTMRSTPDTMKCSILPLGQWISISSALEAWPSPKCGR
jgi:hypothetical protein